MNYLEFVNIENVVKWRNHLHANPELSFEEIKTSQYIFDVLTSFGGLEITRPTKTSVVAVLDTKVVGPTIALRADIDALPMQEEVDVDYKSVVDGVMHSCGHDTHTAMLLGAVEFLLSKKDELTGKIKFIFQHAEEVPPGGARELVEAGVIDDVDQIYGLHIAGGFPTGLIASRPNIITASTDTFEFKLRGKGSHGSTPENSIDLTIVSSEIINALQTIVARNISATQTAVVSVGQLNIGTAPNIIAETAYMAGTVRALDAGVRDLIEERIKAIVNGVATMHGASVEIDYLRGYSSVKNDPECYKIATDAAKKIVTERGYQDLPSAQMGAEDFSSYTDVKPGCFLMVGGSNEPGYEHFNHSPKFRISKQSLAIGAALHIQIAMDILKK